MDWDGGQEIVIPTYFHILHNGDDGRQFLCQYSPDTGFVTPTGGNCEFTKEQMRVLNRGMMGIKQDTQPTQYNSDTKIRFCLLGANNLRPIEEYDNANAYRNVDSYKSQYRAGEMETLNVWVNTASGYLGYATFPSNSFSTSDGVVILNTSVSLKNGL